MRQFIAIGVAALALQACASKQATNDIIAACADQSGKITADCAKRHPSFSKLSQADQRSVAYKSMLDEQLRAGKITQAQADFMFVEYSTKAKNEQTAAHIARARAMDDGLGDAGTALLIAGAAQSARPQPTNTSCNAFMNTINCTSY